MACVLLPTILFTNPTEETGDEGALIIGEDPQCVNRSAEEQWSSRGLLMYFVHFFTGQGFLQTSYLFYGHYKQRGISSSQFNISLSYLLSVLAYFLFCFAWITRQMVKEMIQKRMHSRDYRTRLSTKVFSGWDYCIRSTEAAVIKQHSISNDLKMDLEEEVRYLEKLKMTPLQKALLAITRTLVNVVILLLMAGAFYSIFLVTTISQDRVQRFSSEVRWSVLTEYLPPLILNLSTFLLPIAFAALVRLEGYTPNTEVNITLMRCVLLKLASLGMFLFSLGQKMLCFGQPKDPNCSACGYNKHYQCWETTLGQEMYKMTVFDFLCTLLLTLLVRLPRRLLVDKTSWRLTRWIGKEEFVLPLYILDIVAGQTVVWIGIFYCPLLPLLNSISLFVTFYLTKFNLCNLCKPSKKLFRASSSKFFFQFVLLLGLSLAVIPLLYNIFNSPPSQSCGLFANYPTAWHVVPKTMAASLPPVAQRIMNYAGSDAFALPLLIIFCLVLTVYISQDRAHRQTIRQLKAHLVMQAKDKRFLVEELSSAMRGSRQAL
ncbi:transmembrane channel-like protein 8 isoform X2 [Ambystoma mexicanum]